MPPRSHDEVRKAFVDFFEARDHRAVPSYSLVPPDDPTLLFVNAGMVQFKDVFTGMRQVPYRRAASCQKCLRVSGKHNDLDNVGRTARHHTFFEMLGNFSFGDYFKEEAICWGWELLTEVYGLDPGRLWVSVHPDDDEAYAIWHDRVGVPEARIVRDPENFWSMGDTGPCGPCSEIHIDQGPVRPEWVESTFGDGSDRYLELWNLVFMQSDRDEEGKLSPLPRRSIDTGMGLERVVAVLQGKTSNYDTDLFTPLIARVERAAARRYGEEPDFDLACRVLADHSRAAAFLIGDGVYPSNEGSGYVLRRILRRAIRFAKLAGIEGPSVSLVGAEVVALMSAAYPEVGSAREVIDRVLRQEEDRFGRTLVEGERLLELEIARVREAGRAKIPGSVAFTLYDTHGFPYDLTELIASEQGLGIDRGGFDEALEAQRRRSRSGRSFASASREEALDGLAEEGLRSDFQGYDRERAEAVVQAIIREGRLVERLEPGQEGEVLLDRTPFYPESGGQVGDVGRLRDAGGASFLVGDTLKYGDAIIRHPGRLEEDGKALAVGARVTAEVAPEARAATRRNHSATHLLHLALREVLGEHVRQRGSLVSPERLRFDFSHFGPVSSEEIERIEVRVNQLVVSNFEARTEVLPFDEAVAAGAIAFFEEKYGDRVRVLHLGPSVELCGGTHVRRSGDIGLVTIVAEGSVQSGVRRIEARTGLGAIAWMHDLRRASSSAAALLRTHPADLPVKVAQLQQQRKELERELKKARAGGASQSARVEEVESFQGVRLQAVHLKGADRKSLLPMLDELRARLDRGLVLITSLGEARSAVLLGATDSVTDKVHAGNLLRAALQSMGGRGGGNARTGQGGLEGADEATISRLTESVRQGLSELL